MGYGQARHTSVSSFVHHHICIPLITRIISDILGDGEYTPLPYPSTPIRFHTFPDPRLPSGSHFRFVVSSCVTPNFPYTPFRGRRIKGFDLLADYLWPSSQELSPSVSAAQEVLNESQPLSPTDIFDAKSVEPEFMLFLGDFIYADVPVYFGDNVEAYRRLYRRNYQSDSFRKIYEHIREGIFYLVDYGVTERNNLLKRFCTHMMIMKYMPRKSALIVKLTTHT